VTKIETLKKRQDFISVKTQGVKYFSKVFIIQSLQKGCISDVRWGFIITRKVGCAVIRNRIRRRLREAIKVLESEFGLPSADYVIIPRPEVAKMDFSLLKDSLKHAILKTINLSQQDEIL
jgi:ribonuclease P protein component